MVRIPKHLEKIAARKRRTTVSMDDLEKAGGRICLGPTEGMDGLYEATVTASYPEGREKTAKRVFRMANGSLIDDDVQERPVIN